MLSETPQPRETEPRDLINVFYAGGAPMLRASADIVRTVGASVPFEAGRTTIITAKRGEDGPTLHYLYDARRPGSVYSVDAEGRVALRPAFRERQALTVGAALYRDDPPVTAVGKVTKWGEPGKWSGIQFNAHVGQAFLAIERGLANRQGPAVGRDAMGRTLVFA